MQSLSQVASIRRGQIYWQFKQPGISNKAIVDKTCHIERHPGCELKIHGECTVEAGIKIRISQNGSIEFFDHVHIRQNCYIEAWGSLVVGQHSGFNIGCYVVAIEQILIGENVMLGPYVVIVDHDHGTKKLDAPMLNQELETAPITIHDDVWVGSHVTVTKGVTIGQGAVIGANAVVTSDIPEYGIALGVPARVVGYRKQSTHTDPDANMG